ncbi:DUF2147 domain-containing protein [Phenylobacterium sp.]|uniref:DUF2147 domain-containing protein n=1 Tax=Phenylobacterium sp. TaxID=1871053 RepID=UPI0035B381B0
MKPLAFLPLAAALAAAGAAHAADPAQGVWLTPDGAAKVKVAPCAASLCGTVVWLKAPLDKAGKPLTDQANPDPALRSRPIVGLVMISDFKAATAGRWTGGKIYDPKTGRTYASKLSANPDGTLKVEGCVSVACKAQTWTRAD